jgi:hypothetical protein
MARRPSPVEDHHILGQFVVLGLFTITPARFTIVMKCYTLPSFGRGVHIPFNGYRGFPVRQYTFRIDTGEEKRMFDSQSIVWLPMNDAG